MNELAARLGGTAEVAAALGCPKQQLHSLRRRRDFPSPIVTLAATPIWDLTQVQEFSENWKRKKTPA